MFLILFNMANLSSMRNTFRPDSMRLQARAQPARRPRLGRHSHPLLVLERFGHTRRHAGQARPAQQVRKKTGQFDPGHDSIKVMTMHVSKGLEFPAGGHGGRGPHARRGRRRARGIAALFCGGDAAIDVGGGREWANWIAVSGMNSGCFRPQGEVRPLGRMAAPKNHQDAKSPMQFSIIAMAPSVPVIAALASAGVTLL